MLPEGFQTSRLILRPIAPADAAVIFDSYAQDPEVTRFLTWRPHRTIEETESYIAHCLAAPTTASRTFVLTGRDDGVVRGGFDLRHAEAHRMEFGYVLARRWWGQGLMTEALTEIAGWVLRQDGVFRVASTCVVDNIGSARVMEKAGLAREGLLRRWLVYPNISDEPRDCFCYARVR
jgi:RimJ/RimL family protein N-acetyltransferase